MADAGGTHDPREKRSRRSRVHDISIDEPRPEPRVRHRPDDRHADDVVPHARSPRPAGPPRPARPVWAIVLAAFAVVALVAVAWVTFTGDDEPDAASPTTQPPQLTASMSSVEVFALDPQFTAWLELVRAAGLEKEWQRAGPVTMIVPSSAAIEGLDLPLREEMDADPEGAGAEFVRRHIVKGELRYADLAKAAGTTVATLGGEELPVESVDGQVSIGGVNLAKSDIEATDAIVHVIDSPIPAP